MTATTPPLRIVADRDIPAVKAHFAELGELTLLPGREIGRDALTHADVLLVRTITRVDRALLDGTPVRFVASATSGTDHVDRAWLDMHGIGFADAAGCNARSVAEYVLSGLCAITAHTGEALEGRCVGIVGAGHTGTATAALLGAAGMECVLCDPPLYEGTHDTRYRPLRELANVDLISFHVPLTDSGVHATRHLGGTAFFRELNPAAIVVNASRGGVVDESALCEFIDAGARAIVDVWADEPVPDPALLRRAAIATPHIAGYSMDARVGATRMVYEKLCAHLGRIPARVDATLPAPAGMELPAHGSIADVVRAAVLGAYDVREDDRALRALAPLPAAERAAGFDALRGGYRARREFDAVPVRLADATPAVETLLGALGFALEGG